LINSKTGILDNAAHSSAIHGVMPGNGGDAPAVGHHDVFALANNPEAGPFERPHGSKVRDAGTFGMS